MSRKFIKYTNASLPRIEGAKGGGKGGSGGQTPAEAPQSLFGTDILFTTVGLSEGPVYRINGNGPQDIEIADGSIDDLVLLDGDGGEDTDKFKTLSTTGTTTQDRLDVFGENIITPQNFASPVSLKKGNLAGVPSSGVTLQETSSQSWDALKFIFQINGLQKVLSDGAIKSHSVSIKITIFPAAADGSDAITTVEKTISGKTNTAFRFNLRIDIPTVSRSNNGYRFTIEKTSSDNSSSKFAEDIRSIGWFEIEESPQAYPRTAVIGYALKAVDEHQGGVPTFTSMVKGLLVKVPSNYNQPILTTGEIDWREVELSDSRRAGHGYSLQFSGADTKLTVQNPQLYVGTWDGTFVYSWTQNPVWIIYDILTNKTYGLGVPEENIDKYKFFQIAQYCDACDASTGNFIGVDALADGSFRHKPRGLFSTVRQTLVGEPEGTKIKERRFTLNCVIADQSQAMDTLNTLAASFRGALVYSLGKITLAVDMPDEFPAAVFTEANIKQGSLQISGNKESDIITGADVSYIEPTNHYKRETVRIDTRDRNDGSVPGIVDNVVTLDLFGTTRRSQALRFAQYQIASSTFQRRNITFTTSSDALSLAPGDVISVSQQQSGIAYGYSGKTFQDSNLLLQSGNSNIYLEHFTSPSLTSSLFSSNTGPIALRVIKLDSDRIDLYILSNSDYTLTKTDNVTTGVDQARVKVIQRFNKITKQFDNYNTFTANNLPKKGDLWSLGEIENPGNYYTNKAGKLFKITSLSREPQDEEITLSGIEYIPNVYVDSDTFIDYTPTAYTDILSPLSVPPSPSLNFRPVPRRNLDGSIVVDGIIEETTDRLGYNQDFITDFFVSTPDSDTMIANVTGGSAGALQFKVSNASAVAQGDALVTLSGKNGFTTPAGEIKLLCTTTTVTDTNGGVDAGNIELTLSGYGDVFDENFFMHVSEVNDGSADAPTLKGADFVSIPIKENTSEQSQLNFIGFAPLITQLSRQIISSDKANHKIKIANTDTLGTNLNSLLPDTPFYVTITQLLDSRTYNNTSFYLNGAESVYVTEGTLSGDAGTVNAIDIEIDPRDKIFTRFFVDGILKDRSNYTFTRNFDLEANSAISYTKLSGDTKFRLEADYIAPPTIEIGDNVQTSAGNTFSVVGVSYDVASPTYNSTISTNSIYRINLENEDTISIPYFSSAITGVNTNRKPSANLLGSFFTNISPNPVGTFTSVDGGDVTFTYNSSTFPGNFRTANNRSYTFEIGSEFEKITMDDTLSVPNLPTGVTSLRARNRNILGRFSPFVTKSITVETIPIQKVTNLSIVESLYREQTGGVNVRVTVIFDHITGQEVTDYEVSYRLNSIEAIGENDGGTELTTFNTVKIPAAGIDNEGKIRFTISGVNRGEISQSNSIDVRVTALNKDIRGATTIISKSISGKTSKPQNVLNFTGGQQTDQITLFWEYPRINEQLADLDLKEVVVRRIPGEASLTLENFVAADPLITVSSGTSRKSIPIDAFGQFTYLVRTRDTSGNFSEGVTGVTLTTTRPNRNTVIAAFNEDSPSVAFAGITNTNSIEDNYPSFNTSNSGGLVFADKGDGHPSSLVDNSNGSSSGYSLVAGVPTDLIASGTSEYITAIRDLGSILTGAIQIDIEGSQVIKSQFNDQKDEIFTGVTEDSTVANVVHETAFGGIGHVLGFSNSDSKVNNARFDSNNQTLISGPGIFTADGANAFVYGIWNNGQYTGNVISISAITKASPAVVTTVGSEHGLVNGNRVIIHDVQGMTEINDKELYVTRIGATSVSLFTDAGRTTALNSSGFGTYTSSGVLDQGDYANANSYALVAGAINATAIELGESFFANGESTGSNALSNITLGKSNSFSLVNFKQFSDTGSAETFAGDLGTVTTQTFIRTTTVDNSSLLFANGNVDVREFVGGTVNEGFVPYEAGSRTFRQFQIKFVVDNKEPEQFDFTIDKFRYTVDKEQVIFTDTITYDGAPKTVDYSSAAFINRPVISYSVLTQDDALSNPVIAVTTAASATSASFKLIAAQNGKEYLANSSATVMFTASGV